MKFAVLMGLQNSLKTSVDASVRQQITRELDAFITYAGGSDSVSRVGLDYCDLGVMVTASSPYAEFKKFYPIQEG